MQILAVIGRYGSHLMIVMIFVIPNNFWNGPGISDCFLGGNSLEENIQQVLSSDILVFTERPDLNFWNFPNRSYPFQEMFGISRNANGTYRRFTKYQSVSGVSLISLLAVTYTNAASQKSGQIHWSYQLWSWNASFVFLPGQCFAEECKFVGRKNS